MSILKEPMGSDQSYLSIVTLQNTKDDLQRLHDMAIILRHHKDIDYFERMFERQNKGECRVFIAVTNRIDVGYCIFNRHPKYGLFKKLNIPEIQDLNILSEYRRRGFAKALINHCEAIARTENYAQMGIGVGLHASYGPAQRLYVKFGYIPDGTGVSYDRQQIPSGSLRPLDDCLCLMMIKDLS